MSRLLIDRWTQEQDMELLNMAENSVRHTRIAAKLGRTTEAIRGRLFKIRHGLVDYEDNAQSQD